jgi:hypothetical protein
MRFLAGAAALRAAFAASLVSVRARSATSDPIPSARRIPRSRSGTSAGDNRASLAERMAWTTTPKTRSKPTSLEIEAKRPSRSPSVSCEPQPNCSHSTENDLKFCERIVRWPSVRIPSGPPGSRREPPWVPGAHNPSTIECVSAEAHGLRGEFGWDDGPWPANAGMSLRRRILGSRLRGSTDQRDREPFGL